MPKMCLFYDSYGLFQFLLKLTELPHQNTCSMEQLAKPYTLTSFSAFNWITFDKFFQYS